MQAHFSLVACAVAISTLAASPARASDSGTQQPKTDPSNVPIPAPDSTSHEALFIRSWELGLAIADADRSGVIDGNDLGAFYIALGCDTNKEGELTVDDIGPAFALWESADERADFNHDGGVDGGDLEAFFTSLEQYSLPGRRELFKALWSMGDKCADLNGDSRVDETDLTIFDTGELPI